MALKEVAPVLAKDFVTLKIDTDRMSGGSEMRTRYAKTQQGIPWFVFLDGDGFPVIDSNAADGGNLAKQLRQVPGLHPQVRPADCTRHSYHLFMMLLEAQPTAGKGPSHHPSPPKRLPPEYGSRPAR